MYRLARRLSGTSPWFALVALLLPVGAVASAAEGGFVNNALANPASASPCLLFLPEDCQIVAELNWKTMMDFANSPEAKLNPQRAQFDQMMQMVQLLTSIDAEKEVDRIAAFVRLGPEDEPTGIVAVQGSFNNLLVERRLRLSLDDGSKLEEYRGNRIYEVNEITFCLPGQSTILVGDDELIRQSLDRFAAGAVAVPKAMQNVLERTPADAVAWFAFCPVAMLEAHELADWRSESPAAYANLSKIECVSVAIRLVDDGLRVDGMGYISEPGQAKATYRYLQSQRRNLLHTEGVNVVLASLLVLSDLEQRGNNVRASFGLTFDRLEELWETKFVLKR